MEELRKRGLCRKLGLLEQSLIARNLNDFYNNFAVVATYDNDLSLSAVFSALRKLMLQHSLLTTNYTSKTNEIHVLPKILFKDVVEFQEHGTVDMDRLLDDIENYKFKFDSNDPILKLLIINKKILVAIFEHGYTDGGTGINFHKLFLGILNELTDEEMSVPVGDDSILFDLDQDKEIMSKLPPATEDTIQTVPDTKFLFKRWIKSNLPSSLLGYVGDHNYTTVPETDIEGNAVSKWPGIKLKLQYSTIFRVFNLDSEISSKLIKLARSKKMTVTPIIEVLFLQLLVKSKVVANTDESSYYINSMLPINLRRFVSPEMKDIVELGARVYAGIFNNIPVADLERSISDENLFWELCERCYYTTLSNSNDPKVVMNFYQNGIGSYDSDSPAKMKETYYNNYLKSTHCNTRFSNLGLFKNKVSPGRFNIEDLVFTQSIGVNGGAVVLNIISTEKSGINFCFSCLDGLFADKQEVDKYCDVFKKSILELIK